MSQASSSTYRLGKGPALLGVGVFMAVTGVFVFAAFLIAGDATWRVISAGVLGVVALAALLVAVRFAVRPPAVVRLDEQGFTVARPRVRAAWKQVEDVEMASGVLVLRGEGDARVELRMLDPAERTVLLRDVYDRLNTAHGYTRFG